jgi:hypothetical protein
VTDIPKRPIGRIAGTLHLDSALIVRKQNMQTQTGPSDALRSRRDIPRDATLTPMPKQG